jgi:hypothetical protein
MNKKEKSMFILMILLTCVILNNFQVSAKNQNNFPLNPSDEIIQRALQFLKNKQSEDGDILGLSTSAWAAMAFSTANDLSLKQEKLKTYLIENIKNLDNEKATDWQRHTLALISLGENPNNINGINLSNININFYNNSQIGEPSNIFDDCFGIISLISLGYKNDSYQIVQTKKTIIQNQNESGGWGDVDSTSAAIMALIASGESNQSNQIQNALSFLKTMQDKSGGFISWGKANTASTSWAVCAINAVGQNPNDETWRKNGSSPVEYLINQQDYDGSFNYSSNQILNPEWMTSYTIVALLGRSYPVNIYQKKPIINPDDDQNDEDTDENENPNTNDTDSNNESSNTTILEITYPKDKGLYIFNKKTIINTKNIIVIGYIDISLNTNDIIDSVIFTVDKKYRYHDVCKPFKFRFNIKNKIEKIIIKIEGISYNKSLNQTYINKQLSEKIIQIKELMQSKNKIFNSDFKKIIIEIKNLFIDSIYTIENEIYYMNIFTSKIINTLHGG